MESKRKRKASEKLLDDDENEKKVSKITSKTIDKKLGLADDDSDAGDRNDNDVDMVEKEAPLPVCTKPFVLKKFRDALRRGDCITDIRHFIQKAESDPSIIGQFLGKNAGKPLEIAQVLNRIDKNELFHISYVFRALHLVLLEKMNQPSHLNKDAIETCSFLLNNHRSALEKMLTSTYATHRKSVLKLLTDAVYLAPHLGRELLTTFNVAFSADSLARFTAHDRAEIINGTDEERSRTAYIYFILSFIIEGNPTLIKTLLNRNELLMSIVQGMMYDSKETVLLILNALLKFVLQSGVVTKTKKVQIFQATVVGELMRLFEWKGPEYFAAISNKKTKDKADQYLNAADHRVVSEAVYQFLCELLATRKNGVAFKCLGRRQHKVNGIQKVVLQKIDQFMGDPLKSQLVIEILKTCPELTKKFIQKHAPGLDVYKKNNNWFETIEFFARLIEALSPAIIQYQVDEMHTKELIELIKDICMAPEILQHLRSKFTLRNEKLEIRQKSTHLLYVMFKQCNQYLFKIAQWKQQLQQRQQHRGGGGGGAAGGSDLKKIKFDLINHILALCPTVENILLSLHMTQVDDTAGSEKMFAHLENILDLLLIITKSIPSFIDRTSSVINYIRILAPIYELNRELDSSTRIEFKAIKLMLALEPKALSPKTQLFGQVIQSFFNVYRFGVPDDRNEARQLLRMVFQNTGLFENGPLEIDLWLAAIDNIDETALTAVREFLVDHINSFGAKDNDIEKIARIQCAMPTVSMPTQQRNLHETFEMIEKGQTLKGLLDIITLRPFYLYAIQSAQQLPATTEDGEENDAKSEVFEYLEMVSFYLFHYLPQPETVYHISEPVLSKFSGYMKKWVCQSKSDKWPKEFESEILQKFYEALVMMEQPPESIQSIFDEHFTSTLDASTEDKTNDIIINFNGTNFKLSSAMSNETQLMILIYMLMFVTNQRHKTGQLTGEQCTQAITYFGELLKILNEIGRQHREHDEFGFGDMDNDDAQMTSATRALKYVFSNCYYLLQSFDIWSVDNQITRFVYEIVKNQEYTESMSDILLHYRKKIANQIVLSVTNGDTGCSSELSANDNLIDMLRVFHLDAENCCDILNALTQLDHTTFVTKQNQISVRAGILAYALQRLAELREHPAAGPIIQRISSIYIDLTTRIPVEINYQIIEEALFTYLSVYYHHFVADIPEIELFNAIFTVKRLTKSTIKLAILLVERKSNLIESIPELIAENLSKKELIYPLLNSVAINQRSILNDTKLMTQLYGEFKNGIAKAIEKPAKAAVIYKENVLSSVFLIENCMPLNECIDFIRKSNQNFDSMEIFQLQIIKAIHLKVLWHAEQIDVIQDAYENFLWICVRLFGILLAKQSASITSAADSIDVKKIQSFAFIIYDWTQLKMKLLPAGLAAKLTYQQICSSEQWIQFGKMCLKHGLRLQKDGETGKIREEMAILLKIFAHLCDEFYRNDDGDTAAAVDGGDSSDIKVIFEMMTTHPSFFDIVTMPTTKSALKTNLTRLMYVLVRKCRTVAESTHIPILLAGYQAKLAASDQFILAMLQMYEKSGCDMRKYRPFIFGETALNYYSLNANTKSVATAATLAQEPQDQVIALFDLDCSEKSLVNFPIWRKLNVIDQVPAVEFKCHGIAGEEYSNDVHISRSNIEKLVESGMGSSKAGPKITPELTNVLNESARRTETYDDVYDPAFIVPLMQMAFSPESSTKTLRAAQTGLLGITFACFSSLDKDIRLAAAVAFQRYRTHMESTRFSDNKLWIHFFNGIRNGLHNLTMEMQQRNKKPSTNRIVRIPHVAAIFYARTINVLMNPLNELYRPLSTFLLIKNSLDFWQVPEFNVFFHSPDVNHMIYRRFILDILRDGLKCAPDFFVLISNHIFKALFGYYACPATIRDRNIQILEIVNAAAKIPKSARLLIDVVGILPWLSQICDNIEFYQFDFLDVLLTIINNLYHSIAVQRQEYGQNAFASFEQQILAILLKIAPNLSSRIAEKSFVRFLNIMKSIAVKNQRYKFVSKDIVLHLIKCLGGFFNANHIWDCNFLMEHKQAYQCADRKFEFIRKLREQNDLHGDEESIFMISSLREIIVGWQNTADQGE